MRTNLALLILICGLAVPEFATAQNDTSSLLKRNGIRRIKGKYQLAAEDDAFRSYRQMLTATEDANQAISLAGDNAARNQSILDFQQRIAFDAGLRDQMRVEMRDGTTAEEQTTRRAARRDLNIAKQQRALMGQAGAKPKPKEARMLAARAEEACRVANESRSALVAQVREIDERYKTLAAYPEIRKALGNTKLGPSEQFGKLIAYLGLNRSGKKSASKSSSETRPETSKHVMEATEELKLAANTLRTLPFVTTAKGYTERDKRRNDTIKSIKTAIEKLGRGEVEPNPVDEAVDLMGGFPNRARLSAKVREGIDAAEGHLKKAAGLVRNE
jgi:hypothetical protein